MRNRNRWRNSSPASMRERKRIRQILNGSDSARSKEVDQTAPHRAARSLLLALMHRPSRLVLAAHRRGILRGDRPKNALCGMTSAAYAQYLANTDIITPRL
ncbi:hypothetical protein PUV44_08590 [Xanthomonas arboricola pv. corylina]|nr:hypothetical protein PUV44_08590 [Xanthomonas arboricola pv. corylina]